MPLLWTVVTYLLKNVKQGTEHDIDVLMETLDIPEIHGRFGDEYLAI